MSDNMPRRSFLNIVVAVASLPLLGTIVYPILSYLWPTEKKEGLKAGALVEASKVKDLPPGSSKTFRFGTQPAVIIHTTDGQWKAFLATCTHLACTVQYRKENGDIIFISVGKHDLYKNL